MPDIKKIRVNGADYDVPGTGGGGTSDHRNLTNRDAANQHPMAAITGLTDALASKRNLATARLDNVVEITDIASLRTYFYNLRKSANRDYQAEVSPGNNQNLIEALGGFPDGAVPSDKFFLYFTLPYSEAGGFVIDIELEGRTNGKWYTRKMWGTIDANWRDSGWKNANDGVTKEYVDGKLVTIDVEVRGENNFWTKPVTTGKQIIDMVNAGKEVRLHFFDTITRTGDQLYAYETTVDGVPYFRRNLISPSSVSRINIGVQYNGTVRFEEIPYVPPQMAIVATCENAADPEALEPCDWYVPKNMPRPSGRAGMVVDVFWKYGRVGGIGYNAKLIWGAPGALGNQEVVVRGSVHSGLTGEYSIPAESTVRYQLEMLNGSPRWNYVSGPLLGRQFSSATAAATPDKAVPGMALAYLPGMEIYVQLDNGNTADLMRLMPDSGPTLPVYGNGEGNKTGTIPAGYILHLKNAGDHWQIINGGGSGPTKLSELEGDAEHRTVTDAEKAEWDNKAEKTAVVSVIQSDGHPPRSSLSNKQIYDLKQAGVEVKLVYYGNEYSLATYTQYMAVFRWQAIGIKTVSRTVIIQGDDRVSFPPDFELSAGVIPATVPSELPKETEANVQACINELAKKPVVIPSSTPGSSKKFRLTVDDTGAIKAEEVV